jgi:hypothetical protein
MTDYKPSEDQIKYYESMDLSTLTATELLIAIEDVEWMLQTDSYRNHYLERLEILFEKINKEAE